MSEARLIVCEKERERESVCVWGGNVCVRIATGRRGKKNLKVELGNREWDWIASHCSQSTICLISLRVLWDGTLLNETGGATHEFKKNK